MVETVVLIVGIGMALTLPLIMNYFTFKSFTGYLIWLLPVIAFFVWAEIFDVGILYIFIVLDVVLIYFEVKNR